MDADRFLDELIKWVPRSQLADGANANDLARFEEAAGAALPPSFKRLYTSHNGESTGGLLLGFEWLTLDRILGTIGLLHDIAEDDFDTTSYQFGKIREVTWSAGWIPFAADGSGNFMALDLEPGEDGERGQVITCGRDEVMFVIASSLESFYSFVIKQFQIGNSRWSAEDERVWWKADSHFLNDIKELVSEDERPGDASFPSWWGGLTDAWRSALSRACQKTPASFTQLETVREVWLHDESITDLTPITKLAKLRALSLRCVGTVNLAPILSLKELKMLSLAQMPVADIGFLTALPRLETLSLHETDVVRIDALPRFAALKELRCSGSAIESLEPLAHCGSLRKLALSEAAEHDYRVLAELTSLRSLEIGHSVNRIDFLAGMRNLKDLKIWRSADRRYEVLRALPALDRMTCCYEMFYNTCRLFDRRISYTLWGNATAAEREAYGAYMMTGMLPGPGDPTVRR